ncbi:hypothetical protein SDC9_99142 [bioreactor metagenome]|uniref:Uncharacterized protein n=1 Tax=bioreactor metagenome TaxID=1076179 RepID=A0A645ANF0_9ZZZZ
MGVILRTFPTHVQGRDKSRESHVHEVGCEAAHDTCPVMEIALFLITSLAAPFHADVLRNRFLSQPLPDKESVDAPQGKAFGIVFASQGSLGVDVVHDFLAEYTIVL